MKRLPHLSPFISSEIVGAFWKNRLENASFGVSTFFFMILPLASLMLAIGLYNGFWGENIRIWHQEMRLAYPFFTRLIQVISWGSAWMLYAVYAVILAQAVIKKNRQEITFIARFAFSLTFILLIAGIMKVTFGMPRPGVNLPSAPFSFLNDFVSFPSGHTVQIITAALPLAFHFGRKALFIALSLLITLVGYSRLWLGMHHPIDVLGGICVGGLIIVLIFRSPSPDRQAENT